MPGWTKRFLHRLLGENVYRPLGRTYYRVRAWRPSHFVNWLKARIRWLLAALVIAVPRLRGPSRRLAQLLDRVHPRHGRRPEPHIDRVYDAWVRAFDQPSAARAAALRVRLAGLTAPPLISVVMPAYESNPTYLKAAIASVRTQIFANWQLCIADDASPSPHVARLLQEAAAADARVRFTSLAHNRGIAAATNAAIELASGDYVAFMDHDDLLSDHALALVALRLADNPGAKMVFSDEDQLVDGVRARPYFKPGWNPDLLMGHNLVSHFSVFRRDLVVALGGIREGFEGSQDWDLALRVARDPDPGAILHIPEILYHWRQSGGTFSALRLEACTAASRRALAEHVGAAVRTLPNPALMHWSRFIFPLPDPPPRVSLIWNGQGTPPADPDLANFEIVPSAGVARGDVLVWLATGLRPMADGWLRELVSQALRPGVGAVGGRLEAPDGSVVQSGLLLDPELIAGSLAPRTYAHDVGYRGQFWLQRNVSAVSLACLAVRRELFDALQGFRAGAGGFADIDFCLRLGAAGWRHVWTPWANFRYSQLPAPRFDRGGAEWMRATWPDALAHDPYRNPNLRLQAGTYALAPKTPDALLKVAS